MKALVLVLVLSVYIGYNLIDDFNPSVLQGKNAVVTGASTGIGEQIAYHYARLGANVLLVSRSEGRLQKVAERCRELGVRSGLYLYHAADLSDAAATETVIKEAEKRLGGIDYLVLNHISEPRMDYWFGSSENLTRFRETMDVNFNSYVHLASYGLPLLQKTRGSIVVVSSVAGRVSQPYAISYSASKFALDGFFSGLRQELTIRGIDVSITLCIIGLVDTQTAVKAVRELNASRVLNWISMEKAEDVALAIVRGGATRSREVFHPYFTLKFSSVLNFLGPRLMEQMVQFIYHRD